LQAFENEHSTLVLRKFAPFLEGNGVLDYITRVLCVKVAGPAPGTWFPASLKASSFVQSTYDREVYTFQRPSREQVHIFMPHGVHALIVVDEKEVRCTMNMLASVIRWN
jgi:hypothetical protein